jgi:hypothetical protein
MVSRQGATMKKTKEEIREHRIANARQRILSKLPCCAADMSSIECNQLSSMEREGIIFCEAKERFIWKLVIKDNK